MVLVIVGVAIRVAGLWFYARFRAIVAEAKVRALVARRSVLAPRGLLDASGDLGEASG